MSTGPTASSASRCRIVDGHAIVPERPGNGLVWDEAAVERYRYVTGALPDVRDAFI